MVAEFDRDAMARWYAENHTKIDPGVASVYHLWHGAPDREIRLLEVNRLLIERETDPLEAVDFGVDVGTENQHTLLVVDVTPTQWHRIQLRQLRLPDGWTLDGAKEPLATAS